MKWLDTALGVELDGRSRRPVARSCVDWTERRFHLAGLAGAGICAALFDRAIITRVRGTRAVRITPSGEGALQDLLDLDIRDGICHTAPGAGSG